MNNPDREGNRLSLLGCLLMRNIYGYWFVLVKCSKKVAKNVSKLCRKVPKILTFSVSIGTILGEGE